ncbi:NAD-dependent deacylase [Paenibacillus spongiae]|uniref:protein acetyllysine N-acetyltransferase n=1 Tax=Paenibacillus spongiae TaxID=2909671 RepID=A0ABY5S7V8_9BACL|nr:NAD-dependent deacylase [Paenibacillus spongiae]UVI29759.1 NAD-dependent deacylase [Paenibacillus spongiae]
MFAQWLKESKYTVIFSGAGMSTESGVPDFRSSKGLWQGRDPQSLASTEAMAYNKKEFVAFYRMRIQALQSTHPHRGYDVLSAWANQLQLKSIITQNTDGLHEQAGNVNVLTLHGTIRRLHCNACGTVYPTDDYFNDRLYCSCGGFIRPSVVLFGESLDSHVLAAAGREARKADLFIVLGSSLVVSPANSFPVLAKEQGAKLVIVNHDPTPLDSMADVVINKRKIGDVLHDVNEELALD